MDGWNSTDTATKRINPPLWLLAELTYSCPLQCPYCSNPLDMASYKDELSTEQWLKVLREAHKMGATQLGFSGGEPLVRKDVEILVAEARKLDYYTNLITSGAGMDETRIKAFKEAGLDHIQVSFQASDEELNNFLAGTHAFQHKLETAKLVKKYDYPMPLYPEITPYQTHQLAVDELHTLYVEECGNPDGIPTLFLHGGPGSGCNANHRRYFNPQKYRIVLFDQRGCGRSTPHGELQNNTTRRLLADMEAIRQRLGIETWLLFAGSWGATLALLYAQLFPMHVAGMILRGAFLASSRDIDWFFADGGVNRLFPVCK